MSRINVIERSTEPMKKIVLELALQHLKRTIAFIEKEDVHVCIDSRGTTTVEFANKDGKHLYEIDKRYGCDMTGVYQAAELLETQLNQKGVQAHATD
jgi:hypothetical protein